MRISDIDAYLFESLQISPDRDRTLWRFSWLNKQIQADAQAPLDTISALILLTYYVATHLMGSHHDKTLGFLRDHRDLFERALAADSDERQFTLTIEDRNTVMLTLVVPNSDKQPVTTVSPKGILTTEQARPFLRAIMDLEVLYRDFVAFCQKTVTPSTH